MRCAASPPSPPPAQPPAWPGAGLLEPAAAPPARAADFPSAGQQDVQVAQTLPPGPKLAPERLRPAGRGQPLRVRPVHGRLQAGQPRGRRLHGRHAWPHLAGPYPAHVESLAVAPQYQSQTVAQDPLAAHSVYVAQVPFSRPGTQNVFAVERRAPASSSAAASGPTVGLPGPPDVGQPAIPIHTPTVAEVGLANVSTIDTRQPPAPDLQQVDFASVLKRKPVVLLFATPQLCASRVCGPVTDVEEEVKSQIGSRAPSSTWRSTTRTRSARAIARRSWPGGSERALGVRDRPRRPDRHALRGRLLGRRAPGRRGARPLTAGRTGNAPRAPTD